MVFSKNGLTWYFMISCRLGKIRDKEWYFAV